MCIECGYSPCHPRCPNADEPRTVHKCKYCGDGILAGDEYAEINEDCYHLECLEDMDIKELVSLFGFEFQTAEM